MSFISSTVSGSHTPSSFIGILPFFFVFTFVTSMSTNIEESIIEESGLLKISVDIPCPGHAPLINHEVESIVGVEGVEFNFPNDFNVYYNPELTNKNEILSLACDCYIYCLEIYSDYKVPIVDFFYNYTRYFLLHKYAREAKVRIKKTKGTFGLPSFEISTLLDETLLTNGQ